MTNPTIGARISSVVTLSLSVSALALLACNGRTSTNGIGAAVGPSQALASSTKTEAVVATENVAQPDIVDVAVAAGNFKTLAAALTATNLVGTLKGPGPFTVFAPTDEAFAKLPAGTIDSLLANPEALKSILLLHVAQGTYSADRLFLRKQVKTLGGVVGCKYSTCAVGGQLFLASFLNHSTGSAVSVVAEDIKASNGIIQVIDTVLLNPTK